MFPAEALPKSHATRHVQASCCLFRAVVPLLKLITPMACIIVSRSSGPCAVSSFFIIMFLFRR